jgi:hypothetical protein
MPPKLIRQPSRNVSEQQGPDCWNYGSCRILTRLICNVLNINESETSSCDELYLNLEKFNIKDAKDKCTQLLQYDPSAYHKFLLYYFLFSLGNSRFSCRINPETNEYERRVTGQKEEVVLAFFCKDLLNNKHFKSNEYVTTIQQSGFVDANTQKEFTNVVYKLIDDFQKIVLKDRTGCQLKTIHSNEDHDFLSKIKSVLEKGLYISVGLSLGHGDYEYKFSKYKGSQGMRPVAKYIEPCSSYECVMNGHILVVTSYSKIIGEENEVMVNIKNSWSNKWGDNGNISMFPSELTALTAMFSWIEPNSDDSLQQKVIMKSVNKEPADKLEIIDEPKEFHYKLKEKNRLDFIKMFTDNEGVLSKDRFEKLYIIIRGNEPALINKIIIKTINPDEKTINIKILAELLTNIFPPFHPITLLSVLIDYLLKDLDYYNIKRLIVEELQPKKEFYDIAKSMNILADYSDDKNKISIKKMDDGDEGEKEKFLRKIKEIKEDIIKDEEKVKREYDAMVDGILLKMNSPLDEKLIAQYGENEPKPAGSLFQRIKSKINLWRRGGGKKTIKKNRRLVKLKTITKKYKKRVLKK